jgi:cytosine/adenosine deaminase-related metal-dependent hydrolase
MTEPQPLSWTLTARWILPITGSPQERGSVTIAGEQIVAVEPHGCRPADYDLGNVAVLPGLVNAHTHLDLSGLRGQLPPTEDFTAWLRGVIAYRRNLATEQSEAAVRAGLAESLACGTTLLGDISGQGLSWPVLAQAPLRAVVFHELLGLSKARARQAWASAKAWLHAHPATATCRPGLSPHAPYSVRAALFRVAAQWARWHEIPLALHLSETVAELDLLRHRRGPFVNFLSELGVWDPEGLVKGPEEVVRICRAVPQTLFGHGNYLDAVTPLSSGSTIVYCPRTHAAFCHQPHPFLAFLAAGVRVALGTDSLASNPDLDLLAEVRYLHQQYPEVSGGLLLRLATLAGAEALGWQHVTGSLEPGKSADLVVVPLPAQDGPDPFALLLESSERVRAVLWRGQWRNANRSGGEAERPSPNRGTS